MIAGVSIYYLRILANPVWESLGHQVANVKELDIRVLGK